MNIETSVMERWGLCRRRHYYYYYYYYYVVVVVFVVIVIIVVSCHKPFLPGTYPEPTVIPTAQASSDHSTFRIMCDVPSVAVFCSESIECFPGTASKFFLKLPVTILTIIIIIIIIIGIQPLGRFGQRPELS